MPAHKKDPKDVKHGSITFRINKGKKARLTAIAEREGITLTELFDQMINEEIDNGT